MRYVLPLAAAAMTVAAVAQPAAAADVTIQTTNPVIELSVYEQVEVEPDIVTIGAGVSTMAPTAVAALRQNSADMKKVIDRIKALGVAERDIQTTGINLNAQYDYDQQNQRQGFRGYQASNRVSVKLRQIQRAGEVLDALVAAGATDLSGPDFSVDDDTAAKAAARKSALERAQRQALEYARFAGYSNVRLLQVSESITGNGPQPPRPVMAQARMASAEKAPVQPGVVGTGVNVSLTYEMVK